MSSFNRYVHCTHLIAIFYPMLARRAGDAEITRPDTMRPDNSAPDHTDVLEHGWTEGGGAEHSIA